MAVAGRVRQSFNPYQQLECLSRSIAAHCSVRKAFPVVLWETLQSVFLCVEVGSITLVALWWPLMWLSSCLESLVLLPP